MNCFSHHDRAAVGVCAYCHRGVCADCTALDMVGVACAGRCEENVKTVLEAVTRSRGMNRLMSLMYWGFGTLLTLWSLVFAYNAFYGEKGFNSTNLLFAAVNLGLGAVMFKLAQRMNPKSAP